ncbi:nucleosome assembly protein 1-like 4 [Teleopsis dalmanni]
METRSKSAKKAKLSTECGSSKETCTNKKPEKFLPVSLEAAERRHFLHEMVKSFPQAIQNRVTVLKNVQLEHIDADSEFFKEMNNLEVKYAAKSQKFYEKRFEIISGKFDPPKQEPKWKEFDTIDTIANGDYSFEEVLNEYKISNDAIGIPNFWFTVLRNVDVIAHLIQEHDEPVMKHLVDIRERCDEDSAFTLEFHFDKNDYFTDNVLTKKYTFNFQPNKQNPFQYEGPLVCKSEGCEINWKKDMNLTLTTVKKKVKDKGNKTACKFQNVKRKSFFNFFNPPVVQDKESMDDETKDTLTLDFDVGLFFRSRIIPKAVLYFTGDLAEFDPCSSDEDLSESEDSADSDYSNKSDNSDIDGAAGGATGNTSANTGLAGAPAMNKKCHYQ